MDWIHCNQCYDQPTSSSPGYVLTSCGHIFCETCESREQVDQCKSCKSQCTVIKLTANMRPEVRVYFEDPEESTNHLLQAIRFQKNHRSNFFKKFKKMKEKYVAAKNHIRKLEAERARLKRELELHNNNESESKPESVVSPRIPEFVFTPNSNRKQTPAFNSASTQNSAQSGKPNFSFRLPDVHAYQQYRNEMQNTPNISPAEKTPRNNSARTPRNNSASIPRNNSASTPRNNSANIHQKMNGPTPIRGQSKFPMRTPPYSDFQGMKINSQKHK